MYDIKNYRSWPNVSVIYINKLATVLQLYEMIYMYYD